MLYMCFRYRLYRWWWRRRCRRRRWKAIARARSRLEMCEKCVCYTIKITFSGKRWVLFLFFFSLLLMRRFFCKMWIETVENACTMTKIITFAIWLRLVPATLWTSFTSQRKIVHNFYRILETFSLWQNSSFVRESNVWWAVSLNSVFVFFSQERTVWFWIDRCFSKVNV